MTIKLHLGAHKTATTYLQDLLALNRGVIAGKGSAYWPRDSIRPIVNYGLRQYRASGLLARIGLSKPVENPALAQLSGLALPDRPVLISDENIIGNAEDCIHGSFYPQAARRLGLTVAQFPDRPIEIWLCVRSYAPFLASLYGEALRHGALMAIEEFVHRNADVEGHWVRLAETIRSVVPDGRFVLWRYEDFSALEARIIEDYAGLRPAEVKPLPKSTVRPSASAEAIKIVAALPRDMSRNQRITEMAGLEEHLPLSQGTRFFPWSETQEEAMNAAYIEDCRKLSQLSDLEFLE